ncbi:MAG: hypothetical protein CAF45_009070 [Nitrospira sp. CG24E]|nr:MAG: hypothetical protein CAF45_009070 [Nitrospira sp. CG24E]
MAKESIQEQGSHSTPEWTYSKTQFATLVALVYFTLANLLACSGGSSSSSSPDPVLASLCSPPLVRGSPLTDALNSARASHTATLLTNGMVLVTGGSGASGSLVSTELYNPTTGQWTATGNLAVARTGHTATLLTNGTVLITGGSGNTGPLLTSAELYNQTTGQWAATGALAIARTGHTATLLPNERVLIAGGHGSSGLLTSAELYDPVTGQWTPTGDLTVARTGHIATLLTTPLPNGSVLAAGGHGGTGPLTSTELYDPANGQWVSTGDLTVVRAIHHTATLLQNGTVLVAGGHGSTGPLTSAEIVTPSNGIQVRLMWDFASDSSVRGYKVYYGTAPKSYQQAIDVGLKNSYVFSGLRSGTTYYFAVTAYGSVAEGCASSEVRKTVF